jgi:hypothetical protein
MDYVLTINVSPEGAGGVQLSPYGTYLGGNQMSYPAGTVVTLTAVFYLTVGQFDHWEGDLSGKSNPTTITMDRNKSVTAVFVVGGATYTLTTSVTGNGSINPSGGIYNPGDQIILAATPASGNQFVSWGGDIDGCTPVTGMPNQLLVVMNKDRHITATFQGAPAPTTYHLDVLVPSWATGGYVQPGSGDYPANTTVALTAYPLSGYHFVGWGGDASGTSPTYNLYMNSDKHVEAYFEAVAPPPSEFSSFRIADYSKI